MIVLLFALAFGAANVQLGTDRPPPVKPGDIIRIDTGVPGTGVPGISLWHTPSDPSKSAVFTELQCWAFCAAAASKEPIDQIHYMTDRGAAVYLATGTKVRVVAIHDDWSGGRAPMAGVPFVEVLPNARGEPGTNEPVKPGTRGTLAIPLPYLSPPARRDRRMEVLPVLYRSDEPHAHRYCEADAAPHRPEHVCAELLRDAERKWKEQQKRDEEIRRKGREESRRRAGQ